MNRSINSSRVRSWVTFANLCGAGYLTIACSSGSPGNATNKVAPETTATVSTTSGAPAVPSVPVAPTTNAVTPTSNPPPPPVNTIPLVPTATGSDSASDVSVEPTTSAPPDDTASQATSSAEPGGHDPEHTNKDHCLVGYDPLPSDDTMATGPFVFVPPGGGAADTVVQPEVLQWMVDNEWQGAHVIWHAVRGCTSGTAGGLLAPLGLPNLCQDYPFLIPEDQNCRSSGDGYQFLLFHRHMIEVMKQLWPKHSADFDGFPKFPTTKAELPEVWNENDPTWNAQILEAADIADNIEDHLDRFPDEGALGFWLQCAVGTRAPDFAPQMPYIGLHFNLHDEWSRGANSTHGLNNGQVNITNYMFWKLHGWIDKVWEKYRIAKGLTTNPAAVQKYQADMVAQCREMDIEVEILKESTGEQPVFDCPPEVDETGEFHTKVRPILENDANHCASCHGPAQTSPYAGLTLGGAISSKCVVERLKRESISGGQYQLVVPGDPNNSWLYIKAAGLAEGAGCIDGTNPCNTAPMPPSGRTMTDAELKILYDWIEAGAN